MRTKLSKVDALALQTSMQVLANETTKRHLELLHLRRKGDWLVKPRSTDLHVWELKVRRQIVGWGRRDTHEYTELFLNRDIAFHAAAETIIASYEGHDIWDKKIVELYREQKYEELVGYVTQHFSEWDFEVRSVPVKMDPKRTVMCEYEEGEEDK